MNMPGILSRIVSDDTLRLRFDIREDLDCFRGHFPGVPVLPGVVQLDWAVRIACEHFGVQGVPKDIRRLKFKSVVIPPAEIDLELTRTGPTTVRFAYTGADVQYSEGRLTFPEP